MNYETEIIDDTVVFKLNESRMDANISVLIKSELSNLLNDPAHSNLVFDLSEVEACDSSGLSVLLVAKRLIDNKTGQFRLVSPSRKVMTLLKVTQLNKVLSISDSVEQAVSDIKK